MDMPIFPLNSVLFPGGVLSLRIFEQRYLDMVRECAGSRTGFGVCLIREGTEAGRAATFHPLGSECEIVDWNRRGDGLLGIVVRARHRIRVLDSRIAHNQLIRARTERLSDPRDVALPEEFSSLARLLKKLLAQLGPPFSNNGDSFDSSTWVSGRLIELLPMDPVLKQQLLETDDLDRRLGQVREFLRAA